MSLAGGLLQGKPEHNVTSSICAHLIKLKFWSRHDLISSIEGVDAVRCFTLAVGCA